MPAGSAFWLGKCSWPLNNRIEPHRFTYMDFFFSITTQWAWQLFRQVNCAKPFPTQSKVLAIVENVLCVLLSTPHLLCSPSNLTAFSSLSPHCSHSGLLLASWTLQTCPVQISVPVSGTLASDVCLAHFFPSFRSLLKCLLTEETYVK